MGDPRRAAGRAADGRRSASRTRRTPVPRCSVGRVGAARRPACRRQARLADAPALALAAARLESGGPLVSSLDETQGDRNTAADTIAGLLAVGSIVLSGDRDGLRAAAPAPRAPARLAPVAIVAALVAARMSARYQSLALKAALFGAVAWVVGMVVAIVTDGPLSLSAPRPPPARRGARRRSLLQHVEMASTDLTGPNAAYVAQLLEDYLDAPASVPPEWRRIFEARARTRGDGGATAARGTGLRLRGAGWSRPPRRPSPTDARPPRRRSRPRWRSSRRTGCTATWPHGSIRSAPSRWATPRSTRRGSSRR